MLYLYGVGRLGRDPEISTIQGKDGPVKKATFSVAFSRPFGDETDWFRFEILGKRADVIEKYFHKGSEIEIQARPESYKSSKDNHVYWTGRVLDFSFTGGTNSSRDAQPAPAPEPAGETLEDVTDDVPF